MFNSLSRHGEGNFSFVLLLLSNSYFQCLLVLPVKGWALLEHCKVVMCHGCFNHLCCVCVSKWVPYSPFLVCLCFQMGTVICCEMVTFQFTFSHLEDIYPQQNEGKNTQKENTVYSSIQWLHQHKTLKMQRIFHTKKQDDLLNIAPALSFCQTEG